jgi:putative ABC transport system substrate-binding protein
MMRRREFITLLGGAAAAWPLAARAQQPAMPVIGSLHRRGRLIIGGGLPRGSGWRRLSGRARVHKQQSTISIVFLAVEDPVKLGWVRSLNLPGGDMTGIYLFAPELEAKRLGLLS